MRMTEQRFTYKGFRIEIHLEEDYDDPSTVKAYHRIIKSDGTAVAANITPYESSQETMKMFIDLGMPYKQGNWDKDELQEKLKEKESHVE